MHGDTHRVSVQGKSSFSKFWWLLVLTVRRGLGGGGSLGDRDGREPFRFQLRTQRRLPEVAVTIRLGFHLPFTRVYVCVRVCVFGESD